VPKALLSMVIWSVEDGELEGMTCHPGRSLRGEEGVKRILLLGARLAEFSKLPFWMRLKAWAEPVVAKLIKIIPPMSFGADFAIGRTDSILGSVDRLSMEPR
jgi:hypothetical protein